MNWPGVLAIGFVLGMVFVLLIAMFAFWLVDRP